jgi:hypothetical protein
MQSICAENAKLVAKVENLEAELVDARAQLRAHQYASSVAATMPPHAPNHLHPFTRAIFSRMECQASADATVEYDQGIFRCFGSCGSALIVVLFNRGSKQDAEVLVDYIYMTLGVDLVDDRLSSHTVSCLQTFCISSCYQD